MTREEAIAYFEQNIEIMEQPPVYLGSAVAIEEWAKRCDRLSGAYRWAIAALREQPRWISVEDEKPKRRGHYFVAYKFPDSDMRFYGEAMWHDDTQDNGYVQGDHFSNEGVDGMRVTHWMGIPELPKEEV